MSRSCLSYRTLPIFLTYTSPVDLPANQKDVWWSTHRWHPTALRRMPRTASRPPASAWWPQHTRLIRPLETSWRAGRSVLQLHWLLERSAHAAPHILKPLYARGAHRLFPVHGVQALLGGLARSLRDSCATHILTTPTLLGTLDEADAAEGALPHLRVVALGGEVMPAAMAARWAARVQLINTYGVTECTVYQAAHTIPPPAGGPSASDAHHGLDLNRSVRRLGAPIGDNKLVVVAGDGSDPSLLVQPASGQEGELWIAGPQVRPTSSQP